MASGKQAIRSASDRRVQWRRLWHGAAIAASVVLGCVVLTACSSTPGGGLEALSSPTSLMSDQEALAALGCGSPAYFKPYPPAVSGYGCSGTSHDEVLFYDTASALTVGVAGFRSRHPSSPLVVGPTWTVDSALSTSKILVAAVDLGGSVVQ